MRMIGQPLFDRSLQCTFAKLNQHHQHVEKEWNTKNIWKAAPDVKSMFHSMKHIIEVDWMKVLEPNPSHGWVPNKEFRDTFYYPNKELGDHALVHFARGNYLDDGHIFEFNEFGGDACFVATNSDEDATFIAIRYK